MAGEEGRRRRQQAALGDEGVQAALERQVLNAKTVSGGPVPAAAAGRCWGLGTLCLSSGRRWVVWGQVFPPLCP